MAKVALFSTTASPLVKTAEEVGLAVVVVDEADAVALADDDDAEVDPAITRSAQTNFLPSLEVSWIWMVTLSPAFAPSYIVFEEIS